MASIKKIIEQTKTDIKTLHKAHEFTAQEKFTSFYSGLMHHEVRSLRYSLWAYFSFNENDYLAFLQDLKLGKIQGGSHFDDFKPMIDKPNLDSVEILDRLDYSLNFLGENFDIPLPKGLRPQHSGQKNSVTNERYRIEKLIKDLEFYITRLETLQKNIESFKGNNDQNSLEEYKNAWVEKLTKNQFDELLSELIKYFEVRKNEEQYFQAIQLKQRFNKLKSDEQHGIKNGDEINIELNKITKAILELIRKQA